MNDYKGFSDSHWLEVDPNDPSLNPGHCSTMTWDLKAAINIAEKALETSILKSLAQFICENNLLNAKEEASSNLRIFVHERIDQFKDTDITLHPSSFLCRNGQIHVLATLSDGQKMFFSYFNGKPPPFKGILRFSWNFGVGKTLHIQLSSVNLANLRIFLEKIGPEFAPIVPSGPGIGLGNRMATLDYPIAYESIRKYNLCCAVVQGSVFREMVPEEMFRQRSPPTIVLPGVGSIPGGHTGNSIEGQFVAGMVYRIQQGISLPMVADADHIPIRGSSDQFMKDTQMFIEASQDRTLFTLDPHFCLYGGDPILMSDPNLLEKTFLSLPKDRQTKILEQYANKEFQIKYISGSGFFPICMTKKQVIDTAVRFEEAIKAIAMTCSMIETIKSEKPYAVEVSIDETPGMTEPHHLFYLASELTSHGLKPFSLAPGLGFTKRDQDVEGSKEFFEKRVEKLASIAHKFGMILGIHSGDGKGFVTRKILALATCGQFWYKISPDRQRNLFKAISEFPRGSFESRLYEDIFDWTLCYALRLSLEVERETAQSAKSAVEEILNQETVTAREILRRVREVYRHPRRCENLEPLLADVEMIVYSPSSDLRRDPDSRIIHDYASIYVGYRDANAKFLHRGRFFAMSDEASKAYQDKDRVYLHEMFEALGFTDRSSSQEDSSG